MKLEFESESDKITYAEWKARLIDQMYGDGIDLHHDLYDLSHTHRLEHGENDCSVWPSPPYRAPLWRLLAEMAGARRFLEIGCGLGYTAALMAGSHPESQVDTIENVALHVDLAERELSGRKLADRVRMLKGQATHLLPALTDPYDVVFDDSDGQYPRADLVRLTRPGGVLISENKLADKFVEVLASLRNALGNGDREDQRALANAREGYRELVKKAIETWRVSAPL